MRNTMVFKRNLLFVGITAATAAYAANPTIETDEVAIPITISGLIAEVIACEFTGGAETGLTFDFVVAGAPADENQYQEEGSAQLNIDCTNGSDGTSYAVAMDTVDGDTVDYGARSADVEVDVGGSVLTAILEADQDGGGYQSIDQDFAPVTSGSTSSFSFRATIQDPATATGTVTATGAPELYVRFDGTSAGGPILGIGPLGGADSPVVDPVNGVLNTIAAEDTSGTLSGSVFPVITTANMEVNNALGGGGGGGGIPTAPLDGTPAEDVPEELVLGGVDDQLGDGDGDLDQDDLPAGP